MPRDENLKPPEEGDLIVNIHNNGKFDQILDQINSSLLVSMYHCFNTLTLASVGGSIKGTLTKQPKPMGIAVGNNKLAIACNDSVKEFTVFTGEVNEENQVEDHDYYYLLNKETYTGGLDTHDIEYIPGTDDLVFVNTMFSSISRLGKHVSFESIWIPPFITDLAYEDRCHLNGMAFEGSTIKYASALGTSNEQKGWKENKKEGGVIIDVLNNEVIAEGLCMPHSPKVKDGLIYFLNSGKGELCRLDPSTGSIDVISTFPGFTRGLCLYSNVAFVATSLIRERNVFNDLPILDKEEDLKCGIFTVDLTTGLQGANIVFSSGVEEISDFKIIKNAKNPYFCSAGDKIQESSFII